MRALKKISAVFLLMSAPAVFPEAAFAQAPARPAPAATPAATTAGEMLPASSDAAKTVAGQWDLAVPKNNLKCRVQLNIVANQNKATVGMPAPCRRSMGAMGRAEAWGLTTQGTLRMLDIKGETLAEFSRTDAGVLKASIATNEFTMEPVSGRYPSPERIASVDAAVRRLNQPMADNPATPAAVAGRYKLLRGNNADTGCLLILDRTQPGSVSQSGKASLEKGCVDKGLLTFDPAGWLVERDRMFLYARKGHRFGFNIDKTGTLIKDPAMGSPLSATKL